MNVSDINKPNEKNPRKISDKRLDMLGESMKEYGDISGVVLNISSGRLVGGNQRIKKLDPKWKIIKEKQEDTTGTVAAGYIETPFGRFSYREVAWDEKKELSANIAANHHGGEDDLPKLKDILDELDDGQFNMDITGIDADEIERLMTQYIVQDKEKDSKEDNVPEVDKSSSVCKKGDIWILGNHRLLCGDASKKTDIQRLFNNKKVDMFFCDPPYGINYSEKNELLNSIQEGGRNLRPIVNDALSRDELFTKLTECFSNAYEAGQGHCSYYVTAPQGGALGLMLMMVTEESGLSVKHVLIWNKNHQTFSLGRLDYEYKHEPILYTWKKKHIFYGNGKFKNSVWDIAKERKCDIHPTIKPIELIENCILNSTKKNDIVSDFFLGSGSTLIACEKTNRKCYGMEIEMHYCDVILQRWSDYTSKNPTREDGTTFEELKSKKDN